MTSTPYETNAEQRKRFEAEMFSPGAFVMLHPEGKAGGKPHQDAGRIGQIVSCDAKKMLVEFWQDEHSGTFCMIPRPHWAPVPEWVVEEYEPQPKKRGWRINERGVRLFKDMGWGKTAATTGDA